MTSPSIVIVTGVLLVSQTAAPPAPPAPPPVVDHGRTARPEPQLLRWMPGPARCADGVVDGTPIRRPYSTLRYGAAPVAAAPATLRFEIDGDGRPLSIDRDQSEPVFAPDDLAAALAASRFPAGHVRTGCTISFAAVPTPLAEAPVPDLISYTVAPQNGRLPQAGWDRIRLSGNCAGAPRPQPLVRVMPDFRKLAGTPGVPDWTMIAYDIDRTGRPGNVRATTGTGNRALDAAAIKAMRASRFSGGPRTGCSFPYWRVAETLPAPPMPEALAARRDGPACAEQRNWSRRPALIFPEPYRRRRVEGWAIVRYDVAPWGELGNLSVVAAQPTADFGRQAVQLLRTARLGPSAQGRTGCIDHIRFDMAPQDAPPADPDDAARLY